MNDFVSDHIRISLTVLAQKVIESDCIIFGASSNSHLTYGTIVNKIIKNFDDDFDISEKLLSLRNEQKSQIVRLQNDTIDILAEVSLDDYLKHTPNPSVPKYVRCLLESFARLPFIEREKIVLKDIIQRIESALNKKKDLSIQFMGTVKTVTPIIIALAKEGTFQYLIGQEDDTLVSIRLSRIERIRTVGKSNPIAEDKRIKIDADLSEFGPTFITEPKVTIKVRFSPKGLENYQYSVIHRPIHIAIEENNIYVFHCSEKQALYFFFRFAGEAEILEPLSLRQKMHDMYRSGLKSCSM